MNNTDMIEKTLKNFYLPSYTEIPDVGLYLDQVTKYINSFLTDFPDMLVTPSMISNYVKLKIVWKPVKKVYSRDQIAHFIFIVLAKTVLSMENIQKIFEIRENVCSVEEGYGYFRNHMMDEMKTFYSTEKPEHKYPDREEIRMLSNVAVAIGYKMYLEQYFSAQKVEGTLKGE